MIFSNDVIGRLIEAHDVNNFFKLDDVYIGILAKRIGLSPVNEPGAFNLFKQRRDCVCNSRDIVRHGASDLECMSLLYNCNHTVAVY